MSVTTPFATLSPFPFCPADISASLPLHLGVPVLHNDNLSLEDVMTFAWNLETFTTTTTGSLTAPKSNNGDIVFTLSPVASSRMSKGQLFDSGMWYGDYMAALTVFASWPSMRSPRNRVCYSDGTFLPGSPVTGCLFSAYFEGPVVGVAPNTFKAISEYYFWVGTDPSNVGRYRLYYYFNIESLDTFDSSANIVWRTRSTVGGMTVITSGTITIGGQSLNYWSFKPTGGSSTGGTMSATSGSFTYP